MKRFKHLLLIGAILNVVLALVLPSTVSAAGVTVSIDASAEVGPDASFVAKINIASVTNFDACNYDITYDPSVLEVTDVTDGLIGSATIPVGIWADVASGKIRVIENIPGVSGVTGSGYLAEIHFHVIGTYGSVSSIAFSSGTLSSGSATEITATWVGDSVDVISSPTPTPNPTATPTPISTPTPTPCTASTPAQPALLSPLNSATGLAQAITMQWKESNGAQWYHLQISTVSSFATKVLDVDKINNTVYDIPAGTLNWNTRYCWRVRASNCGGTSTWTPARYFTTALGPPPNDPTNLVAIAVSWSQANLTWQDNSNNETGFKLERKTGAGGTYNQIGTVGANVNSYSDIGLTGNTTYYYRIRSYSAAGNSNYCIEASVTTLLSPPPVPALTSPANGEIGISQMPRLTWNPSTGALIYSLQVSTVSTFATTVINQSGVANTYLDIPTGVLAWNTRYYWRVNAVGTTGSTSAWTPARYFTTALGPPPEDPSGLAATVISSTQINLTWTDNSNNEAGFKIERRTGTGTYIPLLQVGVNVTSYNNTGLTANTTYYYRIRSYSAAGNSNYCSEMSAKTLPTPPSAPVLTSPAWGATGMNLTPRLAWNPSAGASNYSIQVSNVSTFATTVINQTGVTTSFFDVVPGTLTWNTRYYWRVNAVGPSGSISTLTTVRYFTTASGSY